MATGDLSRSPVQLRLALAALITVVAAGLVDLLSGEPPVHAASIGLATAACVMVRRFVSGWWRSLWRVVSVCIIIQPALHLSAELIPHESISHGADGVPGAADIATVAIQFALTATIVALVSFAEHLVDFVAGALQPGRVLLISAPVGETRPGLCRRPRATPAGLRLTDRHWFGLLPRRAPPSVPTPAF